MADQLEARTTGIGRYVYDLLSIVAAAPWCEPIALTTSKGAPFAEEAGLDASAIRLLPDSRHRRGLVILAGTGTAFRSVDVIHATKHLAPMATRTPVVLTVHDLFALRNVATPSRLTRAAVFRTALARADVLLATNQGVASALTRRFPAATARVHDEGLHASSLSAAFTLRPIPSLVGQAFALVVGDLDPRKNVELLASFWREVREATGCVLVLAGHRSEHRPLPDAIRSGLAGGDLVDVGAVSEDELRWLYATARVTMLPSFEEGFGYPAVEALAFGSPLVAAPVPAIASASWPAGLVTVIEPTDAEAWRAEALSRCSRPRETSPPAHETHGVDVDRCERLRAAYRAALP